MVVVPDVLADEAHAVVESIPVWRWSPTCATSARAQWTRRSPLRV
jgi:hypothetical protein